MKLNSIAFAIACAAFMPLAIAGGVNPNDDNINGVAISVVDKDGNDIEKLVFCLAGSDADRQYGDAVKVLKFENRDALLAGYAEFRNSNVGIHTGWTNGQEQLAVLRAANSNVDSNLANALVNDHNIPGMAELLGKQTDIGASNPLDHVTNAGPVYVSIIQELA